MLRSGDTEMTIQPLTLPPRQRLNKLSLKYMNISQLEGDRKNEEHGKSIKECGVPLGAWRKASWRM